METTRPIPAGNDADVLLTLAYEAAAEAVLICRSEADLNACEPTITEAVLMVLRAITSQEADPAEDILESTIARVQLGLDRDSGTY